MNSNYFLGLINCEENNRNIAGFFRVSNSGAYVAKFHIRYAINGIVGEYGSNDFLAGQSKTLGK